MHAHHYLKDRLIYLYDNCTDLLLDNSLAKPQVDLEGLETIFMKKIGWLTQIVISEKIITKSL